MNQNIFNTLDTDLSKYSGNRECNEKPKSKKFDFNQKKNNTIKSLKEVECFLRDTNKFSKIINLYKFLKK